MVFGMISTYDEVEYTLIKIPIGEVEIFPLIFGLYKLKETKMKVLQILFYREK